ncbi:MAG: HAD family hydrolase [Chloroflexi bacterium]|nr:MAG: HAD family hydrolase [Chloroflexota bacterium]
MPTRALLFDLDNTLLMEDQATFSSVRRACELAHDRTGVDAEALHASVLRIAAEIWRAAPTYAYVDEMGMWWGEGLWGEFRGDAPGLRSLRAFVPGFRRDVWRGALAAAATPGEALAAELDAAYVTARRAHQPVDPEAERVLDDLGRDHSLALVTNGAPDVQREKLAGTTLAPRFGAIVISAELGIAKPDPRIFAYALRAIGAERESAVVIGDSLTRDVAGARGAGLRSIWIDRGGESPRPEDAVPDARVTALSQIRSHLAALAPDVASPRGSP